MISLPEARDRFEASTDLTVGIEEEFALLDPDTLGLAPSFEALRDAAVAQGGELAEAVAGELIRSEIEIVSGRGETLEDALAAQGRRRRALFALAAEEGVALSATGTHPLSDYREQQFIDTEHYRRVAEGLGWVARRNNTFSLHVHVGVQGADRALKVCDRLRPVLPLLLALSADSPFVDGVDSGLHSARTQTFTRSFPRCGVPDAYESWQNWADYVELLERTGSIVEFTQLWWSVRPHHSFGTVEVRICDAQMTATESDALTALVVACVRRAIAEVDAGEVPPTVPDRLIEENMWRAIRFGLDGRLLDLEGPRIEEFSASETLERLSAWAGVQVELPALNGAQRQRRMLADGATAAEVLSATVLETYQTYGAPGLALPPGVDALAGGDAGIQSSHRAQETAR